MDISEMDLGVDIAGYIHTLPNGFFLFLTLFYNYFQI
jgi:hypothetical protein